MEETPVNQAQSSYTHPSGVAILTQFEVYDYIPIGVCILDAAGIILFWNCILEEWTQIRREAVVGQPFRDHIPQFAQWEYSDRLKRVFEYGETVVFSSQLYPHFIPATLPNGKLRVQHTVVTPLSTANGTGVHALISIQDLTHSLQHLVEHQLAQEKAWFVVHKRQLIEDLLKHDRTLMATVLSELGDCHLIEETLHLHNKQETLLENMVQRVRERTEQLERSLDFEATLKRITDKVRDSLDEEQILQTAVEELGRVLQIKCCNTSIFNPDHTLARINHEYSPTLPSQLGAIIHLNDTAEIHRYILKGQTLQFCPTIYSNWQVVSSQVTILCCPILDDQGVLGDMWLFRDRQDQFNELDIRLVQQVVNQCAIAIRQSRLYRATQAQVKELEKLNHLKDDFLSTVSHELRTPLANIRMAIQLLEILIRQDQPSSALNKATEQIEQCLTILRDECDREMNLVSDILALQHLEAGIQPFQPAPIQLQDWIMQITETFAEQLQQQQQSLEIFIPSDIPAIVSDTVMLTRVFNEILTNACKFTPEQEQIRVSAEQVTFSELTTAVQIKIENFGVSIPPDELEQIFEHFYRIPNHDPWKHSGTGMGLALVKRLVTYLGGLVWAESEARSVRFIVQLPLRYSPPGVAHEH